MTFGESSFMMITYDRIIGLLVKHKETKFSLAKAIGLSKNSINNWKDQDVLSENMVLIATHFNVSTDYLLGVTDDPTPYRESFHVSEKTLELFDIIAKSNFSLRQTQIIKENIIGIINFKP